MYIYIYIYIYNSAKPLSEKTATAGRPCSLSCCGLRAKGGNQASES